MIDFLEKAIELKVQIEHAEGCGCCCELLPFMRNVQVKELLERVKQEDNLYSTDMGIRRERNKKAKEVLNAILNKGVQK
jgi:hypothetical protein